MPAVKDCRHSCILYRSQFRSSICQFALLPAAVCCSHLPPAMKLLLTYADSSVTSLTSRDMQVAAGNWVKAQMKPLGQLVAVVDRATSAAALDLLTSTSNT